MTRWTDAGVIGYTETARVEGAAGSLLTIENAPNGRATISTYEAPDTFGERRLSLFVSGVELDVDKRRDLARALLNGDPLDEPRRRRFPFRKISK